MGVGFVALEADAAEQGRLVTGLQPEFADVLGAAVGVAVDFFLIVFVDAGDVTERVHGHAAQGIVPLQTRLQLDPIQVGTAQRHPRRFLFGQMGAQDQCFEARPLAQ